MKITKELEKHVDIVTQETVELETFLGDLRIDAQEDFDLIVDLIDEYKEKKEFLDSKRDKFNKPINELRREVNEFFLPIIKRLETCIQILREKIVEYEIRRNEQRIADIKTKKKPSPKLKSDKVSYRNTWEYVIDDFDLIPKEYLTLDHSKVKIELREKGGDLEIPGIEIRLKKIPIVG